MRQHTKEFKNEIQKNGRQLDSKIIIKGSELVLGAEDLLSVTPVTNSTLLKSVMKEVDFESKQKISVGQEINVQSGVKVGNKFEYLIFGNYVVYKNEYNAETESYSHICYDKMLNTMIDYTPLDVTYPINLREYINAIATKCGLKFTNKDDTFPNYDTEVNEDHFSNGNYTFRDVLDYVNQLVGGWFCINDNDELEIRYPELAINYGEASGESLNFISDVSDEISKLTIDGKSYQATSTNPVSPSPDYPSEIESVKGKNLYGNITWKVQTYAYFQLPTLNEDYTLSLKLKEGKQIPAGLYVMFTEKGIYDKTQKRIDIIANGVQNSAYIINTKDNVKLNYISVYTPGYKDTLEEYFDIQLEKGTVATDYLPYNTIQVKDVGKNLVNPTLQSYTNNGVTFTNNGDGTYTLNGTSTAGMDNQIRKVTDRINVYKDKFYKLSVKEFGGTKSGNASANVRLVIGNTNTWGWLVSSGNAKQPSDDGYIDIVNYYIANNVTFNNYRIGIQLEIVDNASSSSTEWEQYKSNSVNIDLQGNELCSLPNNIKDELIVENGRAKIIKNARHISLAIKDMNNGENFPGWRNVPFLRNDYPNQNTLFDNITSSFLYNIGVVSEHRIAINTTGSGSTLYLSKSYNKLTQSEWKEQYPDLTLDLYYKVPQPYEIDLGKVETLSTFKGVNNVSLNATLSTNMSITYVANFEELDKHYLKDVNVSFTKKYGAINSVVFSRGGGSDNIYRRDITSITKNGLTEIKIADNPFLEGDDRENFIQSLFDKINGLEFYIMDVASTGIMYLELGDLYYFNMVEEKPSLKSGLVKSGMRKAQGSSGGKHLCLLMNDEINITQGLEENIYTDEPEITETDYKTASITDTSIKNAIIQTNKNSAEILLKVNSDEVVSAINLSPESIKISSAKLDIDAIATFTNSKLAEAGSTVINGANITTGSISCDRLNGGTINGQAIRGGSISIEKGVYYFNMGTSTSNPNCSGLNVGGYGIKAYSDITATGFAITDSDTGKSQSINIYDGHGKVWYLTFTGGILTASEYK